MNRDEVREFGLSKCARLWETTRCGRPTTSWWIRDREWDGFMAIGLCSHCEWWWNDGQDGWRKATREEAEVWLVQSE